MEFIPQAVKGSTYFFGDNGKKLYEVQKYLGELFEQNGYSPLFLPVFVPKEVFKEDFVGPIVWDKLITAKLKSGEAFLAYEGTIPTVWIIERERMNRNINSMSWYPQKVWYNMRILRDENPEELGENGRYIDAVQIGAENVLGPVTSKVMEDLPNANAEILKLAWEGANKFTPTVIDVWPLGAVQELIGRYGGNNDEQRKIALCLDECGLDFEKVSKTCRDRYGIKTNDKLFYTLEEMYSVGEGDCTESVVSRLRRVPSKVIQRLDQTLETLEYKYGLAKDRNFRVKPDTRGIGMYALDIVFEGNPMNNSTGAVLGGGVYEINDILGTGFGLGGSRIVDASR